MCVCECVCVCVRVSWCREDQVACVRVCAMQTNDMYLSGLGRWHQIATEGSVGLLTDEIITIWCNTTKERHIRSTCRANCLTQRLTVAHRTATILCSSAHWERSKNTGHITLQQERALHHNVMHCVTLLHLSQAIYNNLLDSHPCPSQFSLSTRPNSTSYYYVTSTRATIAWRIKQRKLHVFSAHRQVQVKMVYTPHHRLRSGANR